MTCRENALIAREYQKPYLAKPVTNYYQREYGSFQEYVYECKAGHTDFPACCLSKEADEENENICFSKYISTSILLIVSLLALLFN